MRDLRMHYSAAAHCSAEVVVLPCGCKITDTTVLAMCIEHAETLRQQRNVRDCGYRAFQELLDSAAKREGKQAASQDKGAG